MSNQKLAIQVMGPIVQEVAIWLAAKEEPGTKRPAVIATLPRELQTELATERMKARHELGHALTKEEYELIGVKPPALEAPEQQSHLTVTTGPVPES